MRRAHLLAWAGLLLLLLVQVGAALLRLGWVALLTAPVMLAIVAVVFMEVGREPPLARILAIAGLFWLAVLIGLGSVDFLARHDTPAPVLTER